MIINNNTETGDNKYIIIKKTGINGKSYKYVSRSIFFATNLDLIALIASGKFVRD